MNPKQFDVVVIGGGSAGLAAHAAARRSTHSVLLVEGGEGGTTCARVGCMPSKLLIAAAQSMRHVKQAGVFGIEVSGVSVNGQAVMRRLQVLRDEFVAGVLRDVGQLPPEQRMKGMARFESATRLLVGEEHIEAARVVIATGSKPTVPEPFRALGDRVLTTDNLFDLPTLPESLAVVGGGPIGLELGQAFHALGVRTRLFNDEPTLGPQGDEVITAEATRLFSEDMPCELGVKVEPTGLVSSSGAELAWTVGEGRSGAGERRTETFEYVLVCIGRKPSLKSLGLEATGLELDKHGVPSFDAKTMQCGDSTIFLAGDVDARKPILHEAAADGRIAGQNAAMHPNVAEKPRTVPLSIAFTEPQFASIGESPSKLDMKVTAVGKVVFAEQGRARVIAEAVGLGHLYADTTSGVLLGAQLVGPAVEHLAHLLAWTIQQHLTVDAVLEMPFYHPTLEEGLRTALRQLRDQIRKAKKHDAAAEAAVMDCGPCS
ncbi:MAG: dihydrolipoamide dehydrogenase [Rhizobacter sp.]|nr:dihydrolipoamide dehydrogenase [Rhizobacter sp.]